MTDCLRSQETREALGIRLEGAVIVVDEAHNLVDAVNAAHSASVDAAMAAAAAGQIHAYWGRFGTRLAPGEPRQNPLYTLCLVGPGLWRHLVL